MRAVEETPLSPDAAEPVVERILGTVSGLAARVDRVPDEVPRILRMNLGDPGRFADLAATLCNLKLPDRDAVLQELDVAKRLGLVLASLEEAWDRAREVTAAIGPGGNAAASEAAARRRSPATAATARARSAAASRRCRPSWARWTRWSARRTRCCARWSWRGSPTAPPPWPAARRSACAATPPPRRRPRRSAATWRRSSPSPGPSARGTERSTWRAVEEAFGEEHLGMEESKQRLLEVLAVAELRGDLRGPIPCIVGPPGVGKRTLATAIARGLGRPVVRLELGGRGEGQLVGTAARAAARRSAR